MKTKIKKACETKMVKDEEYVNFLKAIISCINHGDYYSVKELSNLELERMKKKQKNCKNA